MIVTHQYLIAYDVANARRLKRIHRLLVSYGIPLQYSLFYARLTSARKAALVKKLQATIDVTQDALAIYRISVFQLSAWHKVGAALQDKCLIVE